MQFKKLLLLICVILIITSCAKDNFTDPDDERFDPKIPVITIDPNTQFQTIDHFGASDAWSAEWIGRWPDASKEPIAKLLFSMEMDSQGNPEGIGLTMWRFNIGEGAAEMASSGYAPANWKRETECFLDEQGNYDWTEQAGSRWFMEKAREYGVDKFTAWTNCPPYFMTENGYTFRTPGVTGYNIKESNYEPFAQHLATVIKHFRDDGYNFVALSPINEPQYEWSDEVGKAKQSGSLAFNGEIARLVRHIDDQFSEMGINSSILIPEAGQLRYLYEGTTNTTDQVEAFFNPARSTYVGDLSHISYNVAAHSYWSTQSFATSINHRKALKAKLQSMGSDLSYWQTEYSILGTDYRQGKDESTLEPMDYSLWLARIIQIDLIHADCSGWSYWTALNNSTFNDHPDRFCLILWKPNANAASHTDGGYEIRKNLYAYGNFSRFIRPGMKRINVSDSEYGNEVEAANEFMVSGYIDESNKKIVLVCTNFMDNSRTFNLEFYNQSYSIVDNQIDVYTTSAVENLKHTRVEKEEIKVPAKSITTLIINYN